MTAHDSDLDPLNLRPRFERHILVCVNQRGPESPKRSCGACGEALRLRFVDLIARHSLKGRVRASKVHCLDACELGPVVLIYSLTPGLAPPGEIWYVGVNPEDAEPIFAASVLGHEVYPPRLARPADWEALRASRAAEKRERSKDETRGMKPEI